MSSSQSHLRSHRWTILIIGGLGVILALASAIPVGCLIHWRFVEHDMTGLQGTWRDPGNPKHIYEFRRNGEVDTWTGSKSFFNRIGWTATWRRKGQTIFIDTDRNWDFEGQLEGNTIRGKMIMRDATGEIQPIDVIWQRD